MDFSLEELNILHQALRGMVVNGNAAQIADLYINKIRPLEDKIKAMIDEASGKAPADVNKSS